MNTQGRGHRVRAISARWKAAGWWLAVAALGLGWPAAMEAAPPAGKVRLFVVSSYNREYLWSQDTNQGVCAALLKFGYLDTQAQADAYTANDFVESSKAVIQKVWMDTKRKSSKPEMEVMALEITEAIKAFKPDLIFLGDDNAANYIGNQFLDTEIPIVFWGINGWPVKYGLVDSMEQPGRNVTGVWQSTYFAESLQLLHTLAPGAKTFGVLACDSETTRAKIKQVQQLDQEGALPLKLREIVATNSYADFQRGALELARQVDALLVLNHDTLKDDEGRYVEQLTAGRWYLEHVSKPEAADQWQFVHEGLLCAADDSGFNQGYEAVVMAEEILDGGMKPAQMRPRTPKRGPLIVNRQRARMLGITISDGVAEEIIEEASALKTVTEVKP